eukprot:4170557-Pyramimonas_sp.AAC.1
MGGRRRRRQHVQHTHTFACIAKLGAPRKSHDERHANREARERGTGCRLHRPLAWATTRPW